MASRRRASRGPRPLTRVERGGCASLGALRAVRLRATAWPPGARRGWFRTLAVALDAVAVELGVAVEVARTVVGRPHAEGELDDPGPRLDVEEALAAAEGDEADHWHTTLRFKFDSFLVGRLTRS